MATQPTQNAVPSESPRDLKFNAGKIDEFVTSLAEQYLDRFGNHHYTIEGLKKIAQDAIAAFGWITLDSFEEGSSLTLPNQVLRYKSTGEYYRWDGEFPKNVPVGSAPESSGGIAEGAWVSVGDAALRQQLASSEEGLGDELIAVKQPYLGAIKRTQHNKNTDLISVKDFGAKGDGVTDDFNSLQLAMNSGIDLHIPPGVYISSSIIVVNDGVSISGAGLGNTEIRFTGVTKGIKVLLKNTYKPFNISDLSITTTGTPSEKQSAITISGTSQFSGNKDSLGRNILANRTMKRGSMQRIDVRGVNVATQAWQYGYVLTSLMNFNISDISFSGLNVASPYSGRAIVINGDGIPVDLSITRFWIYFAEMAVYCPDYVEGVHLDNFELVNVTYGIYGGFYSSTDSVIPSGTTGALAFYVSNGHINCRAIGVNLNNTNQDKIHDLLIYTTPTSTDTVAYGVRLVGGANNKVHDIHVELSGAANTPANNRGILLETIQYSNVHDISVNGLCQSSVTVTGGSQNNIIDGITGNNVNYLVDEISGVNNLNKIGPSIGETYNIKQFSFTSSTQNRIVYQKVYLTSVITVTGGIGTLTITPPRTLSAKPISINVTMNYSTSNTLTGYYDYDTSTVSSLVVRVRSSDVSSTHSVRVCIEYPLT